MTDEVSWYNVLKRGGTDPLSGTPFLSLAAGRHLNYLERLSRRHLAGAFSGSLSDLMNGPIRRKLSIIPDSVSWGGQKDLVFMNQNGDFMKPVIDAVDYLLTTPLKVIVYNGQLDLICDTVGVEMWMKKLKWPYLNTFYSQPKVPFHAGPQPQYAQTAGFVKKYRNLYFFWIMRAGHMVPGDAPYVSLRMLSTVFR